MGAECCRDNNINRDMISKLQQEIQLPITNKEYYIHEWPSDEMLQEKLTALWNQNQEYKELLDNQKVMKHKFYDKYYVGHWNQQGYPDGKGILLVPDYFLYHGQFHKMPSGVGTVELFRQKIQYEGQLKDGKAEGKGKITSSDGRYTFDGIMSDSNPQTGTIVLNNPHDSSKSYKINIQNFPQGQSEIQYADGRKYCGKIDKKSFAPQGKGVAVFPDTSRYDGSWQQGEMHGSGYFTWPDGSSYRGEYQHGRKHGMGMFMFPSGKHYEGQWVHGRQHGKGALMDKTSGVIQKGIWKDGVFLKENEEK